MTTLTEILKLHWTEEFENSEESVVDTEEFLKSALLVCFDSEFGGHCQTI